MEKAESAGISCDGCAGTCCTYEANSMMVTPIEACELMFYLQSNNLQTDELKKNLEENVKKFRLDHESGNGRRSFMRRSYTCPFFQYKSLGCPLPRDVKPYGCLAFNTHHETLKHAPHCYSDVGALEKLQEFESWEKGVNEKLRVKFNLYWEKRPIPTALLDLWGKPVTLADLQ